MRPSPSRRFQPSPVRRSAPGAWVHGCLGGAHLLENRRAGGRALAREPVPADRAGPCASRVGGREGAAQAGEAAGQAGAGAAWAAAAASAGSAAEAGRLPLVLLLPLGGEKSDLDAFLARRFVENGFAVLALRAIPRAADEGVMHSLRDTARTFTEDVANLLRVLGWARGLPGVDPGRIGLLGVSRGAIGAAVALQVAGAGGRVRTPRRGAPRRPGSGTDPGASGPIRARGQRRPGPRRGRDGGAVPDLAHGERRAAARQRARARRGRPGPGRGQAAAILRNVDPASRPGRLDPALTLLVNARSDHVIPKEQALALREAAGGATQAWLPWGHNTSLLFAQQVRRLALEHFVRTLRTPACVRIRRT